MKRTTQFYDRRAEEVSLDAGAKHVVRYSLASDGQCKLTLMIAERSRDEKDGSAAQDLRLLVMVAAGKTARLEAGEGEALGFVCKGAQKR